MSDYRDVAVEVTIAAPIEVVWRALRDRDDVRRWHGWDYEGLEDEIEVIFFDERGGPTEEQAEGPRRRLVRGANVFELEQDGEATTVRVVMAEPPDSDAWHGWYADIRHGWFTFVQQLRFYVERHRGEDRRTVFLAGVPVEEGQPELPVLLGLDAVGAPGEPYAVSLPTGDEIAGTVWFVDELQVGVTVAAWNDGLLEVTRGRTPAGAILTTYGTDPAELQARWEAWWGKHFATPQA